MRRLRSDSRRRPSASVRSRPALHRVARGRLRARRAARELRRRARRPAAPGSASSTASPLRTSASASTGSPTTSMLQRERHPPARGQPLRATPARQLAVTDLGERHRGASGPMIRRSAARSSSAPAPNAGPFHTATVGAGNDASIAAGSRSPAGVGDTRLARRRRRRAATHEQRARWIDGEVVELREQATARRPRRVGQRARRRPRRWRQPLMCASRSASRRGGERVDLGPLGVGQRPRGGGRGIGPHLLGRGGTRDHAADRGRAGKPRERELGRACGRAPPRTRRAARRRRTSRSLANWLAIGPTPRGVNPRGAPRRGGTCR